MGGPVGFLLTCAFVLLAFTYMDAPVVGGFFTWALILLIGIPVVLIIILKAIAMFLNPFD